MFTKNCDLILEGKSTTFGNAFSNQDNSQQQYTNLNLNAIHQSGAAIIDDSIQSKSISFKNDKRKIDGYENSKDKNDSNLWSKNEESQQNSLNLLNGGENEVSEKQRKKKDATNDSTKKNSSTLSLHIAAYENSIEPASNVANKEEDSSEKQLSKAPKKKEKLASIVSPAASTTMPSPFEIPRQQGDQMSEPEIMQFKASQRLLNPNATGSSSESNPAGNSMSNETSSATECITRACLGRTAKIGDIYDVRTEQLLSGASIFEKELPNDIITITNNHFVSSECITSTKNSDKLTALNVDGELAVSIMAGMIEDDSGSIGYIYEMPSIKESTQKCAFIQTIRTIDERIDIAAPQLKELLASNIGGLGGTHVVVGISWGGNSVVSMTYENGEREGNNIENVLEKFKMLSMDDSDELSVKVYSDIDQTEMKLPTNFNEAKQYFNSFAQNSANLKGKQMELHLFPLKLVQQSLGLPSVRGSPVVSIETKTINRLMQFFDSINESSATFQHLIHFIYENEEYVAEKDTNVIKSYAENYGVAVNSMRNELRGLVQKIRSGAAEAYKIEVLRTMFEKSARTSSSEINSFVDSYNYLHEKLSFIKDCQQYGILIITEAAQLEQIKQENQDIEIYMLFCSFKEDTSEPESTEHVNYFFELQSQPGEKILAVVDVDLIPKIARKQSLPDGCRVVECFNGQYISDDCLDAQKKMDSQCVVACDNTCPYDETTTLIKAVGIDFPCPKCCNGRKEWVCANCRQQILYNFDGNFFCGCGYNSADGFAYKCCDPTHGSDYIQFSKEVLEDLISQIQPLPEINILVIGETGVGKSTWINALANYISHESINDVLSNEVINLIPTQFELTENHDGQLIQKSIRVGTSDNENFTEGQSSTQQSKSYTFRHNDSIYRIIDTPGIGDSRGIEQDKKNMENIMQYISMYKEIHGICVLMKPNEARLTPSFEFCFKELLVQFHRSAIENIVFCFTQTSGFNFQVGQTLTPLNVLLDEIQKKQKITIPKTSDRMYSFDNMAYRYLCAVKHYDSEFPPDEEELYQKAYNISRNVTQKMLSYFLNRKAHNVEESISIYRARNVIRRLMHPMAMINTAMEETLERVRYKQQLIEQFFEDEDELRKILIKKIPFKRWILEAYNKRYCASCATLEYYYGDDRLQFVEADPSVMDEDPFVLEMIKHELSKRNKVCPECGPNTKVEIGTKWFYTETGVREEEDTTIAGKMKEKLKTREGIAIEIDNVHQLQYELTAERNAIVKASARFAHFLGHYSITPYNDATEKYLKLLIRKEEKMGSDSKKVLYENLLSQYDAEKITLEKQLKSASLYKDKSITTSDIMETVDTLKKLKHYGQDIAKAIGECNKAVLYEASADEMEVQLPTQQKRPSFFKRVKKYVGLG